MGVPASPSTPADAKLVVRARAWERLSRRLGLGPVSVSLLVGALSLMLPLAWCGLWAPYELEVADFSRRIAVALHGADALAVPGADNTVPTLSELGKGQLPFTSVALGFQLFGLSDWAGRLPLALWAALGILATFLLVSRLMDRVAAAYTALVLSTMPLYFLQGRTMLGDGVTLASTALATCGLGMSVFARQERRSARFGWPILAALGLAAGFGARGVLFGVTVPALGVGLGWAIWRLSGQRSLGRASEVAGVISLVLGAIALGVGLWVLLSGSPAAYLEVLGTRIGPPPKLTTHDEVLHRLGFGLFPWSAIAPFALAVALAPTNASESRTGLRVCLVSVFAIAMGVHGLVAPYIGPVPFVGTFALAGLIGVAFRDTEDPAKRTRLLALSVAALLVVFYTDLKNDPGQALGAFSVSDAVFPESFAPIATRWIKYGCLACLALVIVLLGELPSAPTFRPLAPGSDYRRWLRLIRTAAKGRLIWILAGFTLLVGVLALTAWLAQRGANVPLKQLLAGRLELLSFAFLLVPLVVLGPMSIWLARDLLAACLRWLPIPRARLALAAFTAFGLALSLGYYPALAAHLSPRNVFESFQHQAKPGEALAVLGEAARVAPYYAGAEVHAPKSARAGLDWLLEAQAQRRWLVLGANDLGQLNQLYRQKVSPPDNLPILDAISSEVLLASNQLLPGEANENPLALWVMSERPTPARPLDVDLNGQLRCIGWAITDRDGTPIAEASTGQAYDFRIYWEVMAALSGNWKTFIHIDGNRRRFNGDHDTLQGKYPLRFWQKGDFVMDVFPMQLEPHFSGATYEVYFGLFSGEKRLAVKRGRHHEDRIMAGALVVR